MAIELLKLSTLPAVADGKIASQFDKLLERAVEDCRSRPQVGGARKVILEVSIIPLPDDTGELDSTEVSFELKTKAPSRQSRAYSMGAKKTNTLYFNTENAESIHQRTLDEQAGRKVPPDPISESDDPSVVDEF
jgi:hypothetical protein